MHFLITFHFYYLKFLNKKQKSQNTMQLIIYLTQIHLKQCGSSPVSSAFHYDQTTHKQNKVSAASPLYNLQLYGPLPHSWSKPPHCFPNDRNILAHAYQKIKENMRSNIKIIPSY